MIIIVVPKCVEIGFILLHKQNVKLKIHNLLCVSKLNFDLSIKHFCYSDCGFCFVLVKQWMCSPLQASLKPSIGMIPGKKIPIWLNC